MAPLALLAPANVVVAGLRVIAAVVVFPASVVQSAALLVATLVLVLARAVAAAGGAIHTLLAETPGIPGAATAGITPISRFGARRP